MYSRLKKSFLYILIFSLFLCLSGCRSTSEDARIQSEFDALLNKVFVEEVQNNSITLNYTLTEPENYNITNHTPTLGEYSVENQTRYLAVLENYRQTLKSIPYKSLTLEQQKTYDILMEYLDIFLVDRDLILYGEALGPTTGIQAQLPVLLSEYHMNDELDVENYLSLLSCVDDYFSEILSFEQEKSKKGLFMSDDTADSIINQCTLFIKATENNAMIEVFNDRMDGINWLTDKEKANYKQQNREQILNEVIPAYKKLIAGLKDLKGTGRNEEGLAHFEKGKEYYAHLIRYYTGSNKSIDELRDGLENLIDQNILQIQQVFSKNPEVLDEVSKASFPSSDPNEILASLKEDIRKTYPPLEDVNYQVKYVHESLEEYLSPAFYLSPQIDNYKDNCIYINGYESYDLSEIFTTLAHEGYPGHLYQSVYFNEQNPYPIRNLLDFSGYSEGWASYAEYDSYNFAGFPDDVATVLRSNRIAILCMYGSIDLGINYYGWSYEDTKDYLKKFKITSDSDITNVYAAMVEEPGNYLKYAGGYYEIVELQNQAQKLKGNDFDLKAFREYFLKFGPAPFDVIEKYMKKEL